MNAAGAIEKYSWAWSPEAGGAVVEGFHRHTWMRSAHPWLNQVDCRKGWVKIEGQIFEVGCYENLSDAEWNVITAWLRDQLDAKTRSIMRLSPGAKPGI